LDYEIFFESPKVQAQYEYLDFKKKSKVDDAFKMLKENPFRDEVLRGDVLKGNWAYHVEKNFIIVHKVEKDKIIIRALGDHDTAYTELQRYLRSTKK